MSTKVFMMAGEPSGDTLGGGLLHALKQRFPDLQAEGVGGPQMTEAGLTPFLDIEQFKVMGFTQIVTALPKLWRQGQAVRRHILNTQPDAVVMIDYPGFNLRLAQALRRSGYQGKLVQYGCPTFWAWGAGRKQTLIDNHDLLLTLFPFEAKLFDGTSLEARYVGHPLVRKIAHETPQPLLEGKKVLALFPGSRNWEIDYNLPLQLKAAREVQKKDPDCVIAVSAMQPLQLPSDITVVPPEQNSALMRQAHLALATSGTVTLELALHRTPTVVTYASSLINRLIAGYVLRIRLPHYCMVNILNEETTFPEYIEHVPTPRQLAEAAWPLYCEGETRDRCLAGCQKLIDNLGDNDASALAAQAIQEALCGARSK